MDPVIAGTLIGGGFALIGVAASIWATSHTLEANRVMAREERKANRGMAREERMREKRSALYEQLLGQSLVDDMDPDLDAALDGLQRLSARVYAYASDDVLSQYQATVVVLKDETYKAHRAMVGRGQLSGLNN